MKDVFGDEMKNSSGKKIQRVKTKAPTTKKSAPKPKKKNK